MILGRALQYRLRNILPADLSSRRASFVAWSRQSLILTLIGASLCLAVIFGTNSGKSQALQAQDLQACHEEREARSNLLEALTLKHESAIREHRNIEDSRSALKQSRNDAQAELATLHHDMAEALQHVEKAKQERDIARDLAASLLKEQADLKEQLQDQPQTQSQADRHTLWLPSAERDKGDSELAAVLRQVSINNEIMVAISNRNYAMPGGMLTTWTENVKRAGVKNAMVVALDAQTKTYAEAQGIVAHEMHLEISAAQKDVGSNHAVSGLKFKILRHFLQLGYAVLLSDVDIVTLQNPFDHLYRDSDVEAMSDGWSNDTAYGYNDVLDDAKMGWARYAHSMRVLVFNSGLFYIQPTLASLDLLDRIAFRLDNENGWDQAIFNEVIFFPSHGHHKDPSVTRRVMDYMDFMNSKTLFTVVRKDESLRKYQPVTIHVNYHPDKHPRMLAVVQRYVDGDMQALNAFPDGSI
ncbi:hypothetical protein WJX79_006838 [Trebouxia sp. C0005]